MHSDLAPDQHPRIRVGCQALITNPRGFVLLINPDDHDGWTLPGGAARAGELPHLAATRTVRASTGLNLHFTDSLIVNITPGTDSPQGIDHVFTAQVTAQTAAATAIPAKALTGISELAWVEPDFIPDRCTDDQAHRIWSALLRLTDPFAPVYHVEGRAIMT